MKHPGAYVPLHTDYLRDQDVRKAGPDAELLFLRSLAYCKGSYSDGFIPEYDLPVIGVGLKALAKRVKALVDNDLWLLTDGGWQLRSWDRWNESSEQTEEKKRRARERQAKKRERDKSESHTPVTRDNSVSHDEVTTPKVEVEEKEEVTNNSLVVNKPSVALAKRPPGPPAGVIGDVIRAYVQASPQPPAVELQDRVERSARSLLAQGFPADQVTLAAQNAGREGWHDLAVQIQRDAARASPSNGKRGTADQRSLDLLQMAHDLKAAGE